MNKPETEIVDGQNIDDSSILTSGSLVLFNRLKALPKNCQVEIVCAAPESAQSLILHLSSIANVKWVDTANKWPGADCAANIWKEHVDKDALLIFDGSSASWQAAANYVISKSQLKPELVSEFSIKGTSINIISDSKVQILAEQHAIITSASFKGPQQTSDRGAGKITKTEIFDYAIIEAKLPPEPEKSESQNVDSPESAAAYLSKELGIEQSESSFKLNESTATQDLGVCLVGSLKAGEISRDTILSLNNLQATYPNITLLLPGTKGLETIVLNKCTSLPENTIFADFPENWLNDSELTASCIREVLEGCSKDILFVPSRSAEAGIIAAELDLSLKTGITKIKTLAESSRISCEEAEGSVITVFEMQDRFVGIMSSNPEPVKVSEPRTAGNYARVESKGDARFESIKNSLLNSAASLGIESISDAEFIVDIGYGIGNQDNYDEFIQPLVDSLSEMGVKTSIGASRKLVETLKILPPETQIGQSGSSVSPKILLAIGISGAPQHINYIGKNTVILCFNIDSEAPLMVLNESKPFPKVYPVPGDLKKTIPALQKALENLIHSQGAA